MQIAVVSQGWIVHLMWGASDEHRVQGVLRRHGDAVGDLRV